MMDYILKMILEDLFDNRGNKLDGKYKKVVGDSIPEEVFDKLGNNGNYRKVLIDLPAEELFDKNGEKFEDNYIDLVIEEEYYDKNGNKVDGIYKKN